VKEMRILRIGSTGEDVVKLQSALTIFKYQPGKIDGIFGLKTASAVIKFQNDYGFVPDGIVGPVTWGYLQELIDAHNIYIIKPGDTFYKLALAHNISLIELTSLNPGLNPNKLMIGQTIKLTLTSKLLNTTDPSFRITSPNDGSILPFGDVKITWTYAPEAVEYMIIVTDLENYLTLTNGYEIDLLPSVNSFLLTTDHLIRGHQYNVMIYADTISRGILKTDPIQFTVTD